MIIDRFSIIKAGWIGTQERISTDFLTLTESDDDARLARSPKWNDSGIFMCT